ncbi:hypothetical protein BD309DRAFT_967406 [Dichomitus squalens]|uniref:Uncharacterized protein n=1 Tax=Dichomitus squalens TaxID=114155 RepID=A0A4Q9NH36_9APHY|nr:hypothetical protein BD309DRAFT_967406 [Dichomitus squalens]TBU56933.1 hypothetical protein BD310DRAFT_930550 [Dichomitus squalens]
MLFALCHGSARNHCHPCRFRTAVLLPWAYYRPPPMTVCLLSGGASGVPASNSSRHHKQDDRCTERSESIAGGCTLVLRSGRWVYPDGQRGYVVS